MSDFRESRGFSTLVIQGSWGGEAALGHRANVCYRWRRTLAHRYIPVISFSGLGPARAASGEIFAKACETFGIDLEALRPAAPARNRHDRLSRRPNPFVAIKSSAPQQCPPSHSLASGRQNSATHHGSKRLMMCIPLTRPDYECHKAAPHAFKA